MDSDAGLQTVIELTIAGRRFLPGETRSKLQRISYVLREDALRRLNWPVLDRAQDTVAHESALLEGIEDLQLRYLTVEGVWLTQWPAETEPTTAGSVLQAAIEVNMKVEHWGRLRRLYRVAG